MPNSLKCRLKNLAYQGLLSEKDLSRIYTDNDVIEELEAIKEKIQEEIFNSKGYVTYSNALMRCYEIVDNHITELKGE